MNNAHSFTEGAEVTETDNPKIKFSHAYLKLMDSPGNNHPIRKARLIQVQPVEISDLSKEFIDYDTDYGKYKLPFKGMYLMLIFQKPSSDLFTTLRSMHSYQRWHGKEINKLPYYQSLVGKVFDVVITTEKEEQHG